MKRILSRRLVICLMGFSLFFTGCTKDPVKVRMETLETASASVPQRPVETTGTPASLPDVEKEVGKQTSTYMEERFQGLTGPRAFYFPENHSLSHEDIKTFQVLDFLDGRFYYYYVTRERNTGQEVRALAAYEYATGKYVPLYENLVDAGREGRDSFYCHLAADSQGRLRICLYEDGSLLLLDETGQVVFSRTSEDEGEDFLYLLDSIFGLGGTNPSYFDKDITNVTTDGRYSFYVPVVLYKGDYTKGEEEEEEYMVEYTYSPLGTGSEPDLEYLLQEDLNWDNRVEEWKNMAESGNNERDPQEDWEAALNKWPVVWGPYFVSTGYDWEPVFLHRLIRWKDEKIRNFVEGKKGSAAGDQENQEYASLFSVPDEQSIYKEVTELSQGDSLTGLFFLSPSQGYCPLVGRVGQRSDILKEETREYTITETGSDGEERDRTIEDEIQATFRRKALFAEGAAVEQFYVGNNELRMGVQAGPVWPDGRYSVGVNTGPIFHCIDLHKDTETAKTVFFPVANAWEFIQSNAKNWGNLSFGILGSRKGNSYPMVYNLDQEILSVSLEKGKYITVKTADLNPSGYGQTASDWELLDKVEEQKQYREEKGLKKDGYTIGGDNAYVNPDRYGRERILVIEDGEDRDLLITGLNNGILYYDTEQYSENSELSLAKASHLSDWPLYQTWQTGAEEITSIGFERRDAVYYYMDIAMARVYKFSLPQLRGQARGYQIPVERETPEKGEGQPPRLDEGAVLPTLPKDMERINEDIKENPPVQTSPASREELETLPQVSITETGAVGDKIWKDAQERKKSENAGGEE
ncbi:MAG: hypothetical protein LIP16_20480 [Clostridium sp.]|nr:hypothetical protein [Clostridium sp.]